MYNVFALNLTFLRGNHEVTYLPVYKSTLYRLKSSSKNCHLLIHGSKPEIKNSGQIFRVTIAYLKENSKIKDKFLKKILTQK